MNLLYIASAGWQVSFHGIGDDIPNNCAFGEVVAAAIMMN